jgi:hypothetical protein
MPGEDEVVIKFVQACTSNPYLTWQHCADAVNQCLEMMGFDYRRTAEACREHWGRHLKQNFQQLRKPHIPGKYCWSKDKNTQFMESVKTHTNGTRINWAAVSRDVGDRSAVQCRAHYKVLITHGFSVEERETPEEEEMPEEEETQNDGFDFLEDSSLEDF